MMILQQHQMVVHLDKSQLKQHSSCCLLISATKAALLSCHTPSCAAAICFVLIIQSETRHSIVKNRSRCLPIFFCFHHCVALSLRQGVLAATAGNLLGPVRGKPCYVVKVPMCLCVSVICVQVWLQR